MSIRMMTLVWDTDLPATEKLVMLALADCANDEGKCWPSISTLMRKTGASERTVQRAIQALKEKGLLRRDDVHGRGCLYFLNPRHVGTPVNTAPVPQRREPPSERHPTPVTEAPHPRHGDTQTVIEPSENHQEPSEESSPGSEPSLSVAEIVDAWNDLAARCGLVTVVKLTEDRKRKARTQAKRFSIDDWANVWRNIEQSSFLRGGNERGWRADFNFILSESNFVKILEGKYDSAQGAAGTSARRKSDREIGMGLARDRRTALDRAIDEGLTNLDVIEGIVR